MQILFLNPNTSPAITERLVASAQGFAAPGTRVLGATARFGARYIGSRAAAAVAAHAALDAYAAYREPHDAVVLACFGDPGLAALREIASLPVIGLAEASIHAACQLGSRFAIVTGGARWKPMLEELVAALGLAARLAGVEVVPLSGAAIAAEPEKAFGLLADAVRRSIEQRGAESVILGGAGMAGIAPRLAPEVAVPLVDCIAAAVGQAEALARLGVVHAAAAAAPTESVGLPDVLAARLP